LDTERFLKLVGGEQTALVEDVTETGREKGRGKEDDLPLGEIEIEFLAVGVQAEPAAGLAGREELEHTDDTKIAEITHDGHDRTPWWVCRVA
jgi:hypothetical protein